MCRFLWNAPKIGWIDKICITAWWLSQLPELPSPLHPTGISGNGSFTHLILLDACGTEDPEERATVPSVTEDPEEHATVPSVTEDPEERATVPSVREDPEEHAAVLSGAFTIFDFIDEETEAQGCRTELEFWPLSPATSNFLRSWHL